ncbi:MAG: SIMPL domain-containing protein [Treponema sp.]|nr:SIMPL domain-containing protein [Treponema sp.]
MIKKISRLALTSALIAATIAGASSCTVNKPAEPVRTITVSGTGTVYLKPDLVSLKFMVRSIEWSVNLAAEKNATATTNVINAVKEAGVSEKDITTVDYRITQDNSNTYPGRYTVVNTISVLIRNTEITGNIIDAAIRNGANGLTSYEYLVSDETTAIRQARTMAIQNAQDAASLLAGASGCRTDMVLDIHDNGNYRSSAPMLRNSAMGDAATVTPILEGSVGITTNVTVTYSLQ